MSDSSILEILENIDIDSITDEQADAIDKELVKSMLEDAYFDGVDDLSYEFHPGEKIFLTGKFVDRVGNDKIKVMNYSFEDDGEDTIVRYKLDEDDSTDDDDDDDSADSDE